MGLASAKLLIEAPVNGGRNYNGPKVNSITDVTIWFASLSKTEPYAGNSSKTDQYSFGFERHEKEKSLWDDRST